MNAEPFFPDRGCVGVESLEDRAIVPGGGSWEYSPLSRRIRAQSSFPDAYVNMGRLKIKFPGADDELVLTYDGHRRHIDLQGAWASSSRWCNCITM